MKAIHTGNDFIFFGPKMVKSIFSCQFKRGFIRFGTGIAEEHFIGKRIFYQSLRQLLRRCGSINIGDVPQLGSLLS